jgi:hypothetical protein
MSVAPAVSASTESRQAILEICLPEQLRVRLTCVCSIIVFFLWFSFVSTSAADSRDQTVEPMGTGIAVGVPEMGKVEGEQVACFRWAAKAIE